jgi:hypothetical protein
MWPSLANPSGLLALDYLPHIATLPIRLTSPVSHTCVYLRESAVPDEGRLPFADGVYPWPRGCRIEGMGNYILAKSRKLGQCMTAVSA